MGGRGGGTVGVPAHAVSPQELSTTGLPVGSVLGAAAPTTLRWVPIWRPQTGAAPQKAAQRTRDLKNLLTGRAGSGNGRCGLGGDAGPTGSRGRAHTRQHCTSHPRPDITRNGGSLQRTFKGGNGPSPSLRIRRGLALFQTPEPTAYTCKPRLASPRPDAQRPLFHQKGGFPAESSRPVSCLSSTPPTVDPMQNPGLGGSWEPLTSIGAGFPAVGAGDGLTDRSGRPRSFRRDWAALGVCGVTPGHDTQPCTLLAVG